MANDSSFKNKLNIAWAFIKKQCARVWAYLKVARMEYIVMLSLFVLDIVSKYIVNATVELHESVALIPNFLHVTNVHNYNAAFGASWLTDAMGDMGARILFSIFAVIATVVFIILLVKNKGGSRLFRVALAMLAAGAMGNCFDRAFFGYVRDFIEFYYFGLTVKIGSYESKSFYIFNFADAELVIGIVLMLVYFLFLYKEKQPEVPEAVRQAYTADAAGEESSVAENVENTENAEKTESVDSTSAEETAEATAASEANEAAKDTDNTEEGEKGEKVEKIERSDATGALENSEKSDAAGEAENVAAAETAGEVEKAPPKRTRTRKSPSQNKATGDGGDK